MKTLILATNTDDEAGQFGGEFACAAVEVTAALVESGRRRIALVTTVQAQDPSLADIFFQDTVGPAFLDDGFLFACAKQSDEFHDDFVNNDSAVLSDSLTLEGRQPAIVVCRHTILRPIAQPPASRFEIVWSALHPKTGFRILTEPIPFNYLEQLFEAGLGPTACDCERPGYFYSGVPGILARIENGRLVAGGAVERCDLCDRYPSDEAALAQLRELGLV